MNFPQFWARAEVQGFVCWRWSARSIDDARALAVEAAGKLAARFRSGNVPLKHGYYADRPMREPVLREVKKETGDLAAVVTRNSYGCLVLNTARVMFVDIDLPEPKAEGGFWKRLFGGAKPPPPVEHPGQAAAIAKSEAWARDRDNWGWRIYRTRAGLRLMATHDVFDAESGVSQEVFEALGADPLYRQLCKSQKCFRARLTPKHWRCDLAKPPVRWPFETAHDEKRFQHWQEKYDRESAPWATCAFIKRVGNADVHPEVKLILRLHDETTRAESKMQLA